MELSEILGGAPAPAESTPPVASTVETAPEPVSQATAPTTTVEQPATQPRDERGRWVTPPEPTQAPQAQAPTPAPVPEERQPHAVPVAALLEERRKRQELEARLQTLQQQQPPLKDDDFWQSPVNATQQMLQAQTQGIQQEIVNLKYQLAEDLTRSLHQDYDNVRDGFIAQVTAGDPWAVAIAQQMGTQPNPAKFVYDQAKKLSALAIVGDPQAYEARIRAEERSKVMLEMQQSQARPAAPPVPRSLNSEPSAAVPTSLDPFEPTPLSNLIGNSSF